MAAEPALRRFALRRPRLFAAGLACLALVVAALPFAPQLALRGWLAGFCFAAGVPLGGLVLSGMMRLIPGLWDDELQPFSDTVAGLAPFALPAFLPILLGAAWLYPWEASAGKGAFREAWMTLPFWTARSAVFLLFAAVFSFLLPRKPPAAAVIAGLTLFAAATMAIAVDWILFLDPDVHFSGFALTVLSQWFAGALAASILLAVGSGKAIRRPEILGSLLLAALLAWAYLAFMQYFISWSDNLPPIVRWYAERGRGVWWGIALVFSACRLAPLVLLLFTPVRQGARWLVALAPAVLAGNALEAVWLVLPAGNGSAWGLFPAALAASGMALCALPHLDRARGVR